MIIDGIRVEKAFIGKQYVIPESISQVLPKEPAPVAVTGAFFMLAI